jgi:hypothetical protein
MEATISQLEEDIESGSQSISDSDLRRLDAAENKAVSLNPWFGTENYRLENFGAFIYEKPELMASTPSTLND